MANNLSDVFSKWGRSPRQDRRVTVNGKFVELTPPIHPKPEPEETNTALEVVHEPNAISGTVFEEARYEDDGGAVDSVQSDGSDGEIGGGSAQGIAVPESPDAGDQAVAAEVPEIETPPPAEPEVVVVHDETIYTSEDIDEVSKFLELPPIPASVLEYLRRVEEAGNVLSGASEVFPGPDVLDGEAGSVEAVDEKENQ